MKSIRIRTKNNGESTTVKLLIRHPMETGLRKNTKDGKLIPAHFIKEVICKHNGNTVFTALWGIAISKNPFLSFTIKNVKAGDVLAISWLDNMGESDNTMVTV